MLTHGDSLAAQNRDRKGVDRPAMIRMDIVKTRSRLVSFRLTQDELENLRVACLMLGARNVSDFARRAVLDLAEARVHPETQLLDRFSGLELRLAEIES